MPQLKPTLFPLLGPPGRARTPPPPELCSSRRPRPRPAARSRRAPPAPSGSPSPAGRSLGKSHTGREKPPPGLKGGDFGPVSRRGEAGPRRSGGGCGGTRAPGEDGGRAGPGRAGPRCALTQHEGAEAPGHALGQVVHIELHGVQRQRLLHGAAGTAAGRHPEPWQTPAAPPGAGKRRRRGKGGRCPRYRSRRRSRVSVAPTVR